MMTYIEKSWRGEIRLWKAVVFNWLGGFIGTFVLLLVFGYILLLFGLRLPRIMIPLLLMVHFVFSAVSIWRSSPSPKASFKGMVSRTLVVLYGIYVFGLTYRALFVPIPEL